MMSRCLNLGCVCFNPRVVTGQGAYKICQQTLFFGFVIITYKFAQISIPVSTSCSPAALTPLGLKARPAGHSDLHWPYSVRCVKCRQTVHSFWQEIQAPSCGESFRISRNIHPYRVMHRLCRLMVLEAHDVLRYS